MNKYEPHVYVIPEDEADRQIADGFVNHHRVDNRRIQVMPPVGGWKYVLDTFDKEYVPLMRKYPKSHVIMLIDFDEDFASRRAGIESIVPGDVISRVFVVGPQSKPETLKTQLNKSFEKIGTALADDCAEGTTVLWGHAQINHNEPDRQRLFQTVKPFLFHS